MFFLSSGTRVSLRALKAAFICMVPLIFVLRDVSAMEWVFDVPRSTLSVCENIADWLIFHFMAAAPRTVRPRREAGITRVRSRR